MKDDQIYLGHILEAIEKIQKFTAAARLGAGQRAAG
jgi:uncharacterized protein with HEPN domain